LAFPPILLGAVSVPMEENWPPFFPIIDRDIANEIPANVQKLQYLVFLQASLVCWHGPFCCICDLVVASHFLIYESTRYGVCERLLPVIGHFLIYDSTRCGAAHYTCFFRIKKLSIWEDIVA